MKRAVNPVLIMIVTLVLAAIGIGAYAWLEREERLERERHADHSYESLSEQRGTGGEDRR